MYKLFLSFRYFSSRFLAFAAFLAVTFGVAMLLIVQGVMGGYMIQLQENIRGQESHIQVLGPGNLGLVQLLVVQRAVNAVENVAASAPFIERLGVFRSGVSIRQARLHGIDAVRHAGVSDFDRYVLRPEELDSVLAKYVPDAPDDDSDLPEPRIPEAIREIDGLIRSQDRAGLTDEELSQFFTIEFRQKILTKHRPRLVAEFLVPPPGVIVGAHMILERQVTLGQPLSVSTLSPETGREIKETFLVVGAAKTGDFDTDSGTLYADVNVVRNVLNRDQPLNASPFRVQGLRVALEDPELLDETREALMAALSTNPEIDSFVDVKTWRELRQNMLKAVMREKWIVYVIVLILVIFTGSMILLMLLLTVIEKTRDIGILMSLGATPNGVTSIFLINGLMISILGTLAGVGLGYLFCSYINEIHDGIYALTGRQLFSPEIYKMDRIPVRVQPEDLVLSAIPPVVLAVTASLIPAAWAPRRDPIKAIQFE